MTAQSKHRSKYKIGDRVLSVDSGPSGLVGEIVGIDPDASFVYAVKFDGWDGGHDCSGVIDNIPDTGVSGWWVSEDNLMLIKPKIKDDTKYFQMKDADEAARIVRWLNLLEAAHKRDLERRYQQGVSDGVKRATHTTQSMHRAWDAAAEHGTLPNPNKYGRMISISSHNRVINEMRVIFFGTLQTVDWEGYGD